MLEFHTVTITYHDGATEEVKISRQHTADGVLHLFMQTGEMAAEEHVGSWPLTSIRKWRRDRA